MFKGSTHLCGLENVDLIKVQGEERSRADDFVNVCGFVRQLTYLCREEGRYVHVQF